VKGGAWNEKAFEEAFGKKLTGGLKGTIESLATSPIDASLNGFAGEIKPVDASLL
jgi:hypothetical protein